MIRPFQDKHPQVAPSAWVSPAAEVIGAVKIADEASIWPGAVLRGDLEPIVIGARSNIQDGTVVHTTSGVCPCVIGEEVTVGHRAILHGCRVDGPSLIGMGAILMDEAHVPAWCIVAAGALVPEGKKLESGWLYLGVPARPKRRLTEEERAFLRDSARHYVELARAHRASY